MTATAVSSLLCSSRHLASALKGWNINFAAFQCQTTVSAFSAQADARATNPASTSGRDSSASTKAAKASNASTKPAGPSSPSQSDAATARAATAAAASHLPSSRLAHYVKNVLNRELMLKLGPRAWDRVPRLTAIEASIRSSETQLRRDVVEKWELLLHSVALEMLTGRPTVFTSSTNKQHAARASGVQVRLNAVTDPDAAYNFLEKLVHIILPNQVGFEGVPPPARVPPAERDVPLHGPPAQDRRVAPLLPHATELKVLHLLHYPDFEHSFALFEPLSGMRVRLEMEAARPEDCTALLTGLSIPVLSGAAADAAVAVAAAEAEDARRRELRLQREGGKK